MADTWPVCDAVRKRQLYLWGHRYPDTWNANRVAVLAIAACEVQSLRGSEYAHFVVRHQSSTAVQTFNCRKVRHGSEWSKHASGIAADIRPWTNSYRRDGVLYTDFARFGHRDGATWVLAWLRTTFRWGGAWGATQGSRAFLESLLKGTWSRNDSRPIPKRVSHLTGSQLVDAHHFEIRYGPARLATFERSLEKLARAA